MQYFVIFLLFIILGIIKKNSKIILFCIYVILFVISISFISGHDIEHFKEGYDLTFVDPEDVEIYRSAIFANFVILLKLLDFSFYDFRIVCVFLWSIPIIFFIFKYSKYPTFVVAVCAYFPLLLYGSLIRNGLMSGIVYLAFYVLLQKSRVKSVLLYLTIVGFAGLIHNTAFFYLLAVVAIGDKLSNKSLIKLSVIFSAIVSIVFMSGLLNSIVSMIIGDYYADHYLSVKGDFLFGHIHYILFIIVNLWAVTVADKEIRKYVEEDNQLYIFSRFVTRLNIIMLVFIPLLFISVTFYRIFLNLLILNVISVSNALAIVPRGKTQKVRLMKNIYIIVYILEVYMYNLGMGEFSLFWDSVSI